MLQLPLRGMVNQLRSIFKVQFLPARPDSQNAASPAISKLVEETCREFGVRYREHSSFWAGLVSHFRWLRRMGMPNATA
jgi:hypothetical protein